MGLIVRKQDQKLRNKIAHHDFKIDEKGNVIVNDRIVQIIDRFNEFSIFQTHFFLILKNVMKKSVTSKPHKRNGTSSRI